MMESIEIHQASSTPAAKKNDIVDLTADTPTPVQVRRQQQQPAKRVQNKSYYHAPGVSQQSLNNVQTVYAGGATFVDVTEKDNRPLSQSSYNREFGSSIPARKEKKSAYDSYIKPATPNAFNRASYVPPKQAFAKQAQPAFGGGAGYTDGWPNFVLPGGVNPGLVQRPHAFSAPKPKSSGAVDDQSGETFDLDAEPVTAEDYARHDGNAEKHMQELLSGAIGDGEDEMGDDGIQEGEDTVQGFASGMKLMPHQVRGVKWMRKRETGRKYGGILADDMGLGKTVQTLARIVEGKATAAEKKAGYKGGTLIIAPLAVMEQWASECKTKTQVGCLAVTTHHGPSRAKSGKVLETFDVVITTFQTLASEWSTWEASSQKHLDSDSDADAPEGRKKTAKKASMDALFQVKWLRVVVDEAQNIKNRNTKAAKAAVKLKSKYRWCLTGTPIQNKVEELFSLFQFLRAKPLDDWHVFQERIGSLVKNNRTKLAMKRLHVVLKSIMLRRTKDAEIDGKKILNLPGRTVKVLNCTFDNDEREFYDALAQKTSLTVGKYVKNGSASANYTSVLTLLLRLRQACVHPSLVTKSLDTDVDAISDELASTKVEEKKDDADELADMLGGLGVDKGKTCQMCFSKLEITTSPYCTACADIAQKSGQHSGAGGLPPSSTKIRMLLKLLSDIDERSGSTEKTIVFSQFTSFLDLVEPFLKSNGIKYVRYDGSMRNDKRQQSLEKIRSDEPTKVILISFKAGSTGLNLTCCNNVILMDLWWNPALEDQAFDRAHRLGQKLDVNIFKLAIEGTVEDQILTLQNNKRELAKAALSGQASNSLMKLTMDDLLNLFKRSGRHDEEDDEESDSE